MWYTGLQSPFEIHRSSRTEKENDYRFLENDCSKPMLRNRYDYTDH